MSKAVSLLTRAQLGRQLPSKPHSLRFRPRTHTNHSSRIEPRGFVVSTQHYFYSVMAFLSAHICRWLETKWGRRIIILFIALLAGFLMWLCPILFPTPQEYYHRIWKHVNDEFYACGPSKNTSKWLSSWSQYEHKYDAKIHSEADAIKYANIAIASVHEPHTILLTGDLFQWFLAMMLGQYEYKGCGMVLSPADKLKPAAKHTSFPKVVSVHSGSPAATSGLRKGDEILSIDGKTPLQESDEDITKRLKGSGSGCVNLLIRRDTKTLQLAITRGTVKIELPSVESKMLVNNIGYVRLYDFERWNATDQFAKALETLSSSKGLIIDLRDNPGGSMKTARDICSLFINRGVICTAQDREASINYEKHSYMTDAEKTNSALLATPIVILVNENTASAAELMTAALRFHRSAKVIGEKTYGKGVGQTLSPISASSVLMVLSFQWYTPSGKWLGDANHDRRGIKPDITIKVEQKFEFGSKDDKQLNTALNYLCRQSKRT